MKDEIIKSCKRLFLWTFEIGGIFAVWIVLHYGASNLYPQFCAEKGFVGFIKSIVWTQTPHCVAMRWVIYNGGIIINNMWVSIGVWLTAKIFSNFF